MAASRIFRIFLPLAIVVACALIAAGCGQFGKTSTGSEDNGGVANSDTLQSITDEPFDDAAKKYGCKDIEDMGEQERTHTDEDVKYPDNPPTGGNHNPVPLDWGVYDETKADESWVHNLEHGHIVVSYNGLSKKDEKTLLGDVNESPYHVVLLPRTVQKEDGVWYVAWSHRLFCERPSEAALQEFKEQFLDQGPELLMNDRKKTESE